MGQHLFLVVYSLNERVTSLKKNCTPWIIQANLRTPDLPLWIKSNRENLWYVFSTFIFVFPGWRPDSHKSNTQKNQNWDHLDSSQVRSSEGVPHHFLLGGFYPPGNIFPLKMINLSKWERFSFSWKSRYCINIWYCLILFFTDFQ